MENKFTTGQFAKLANVTERTIRYYDKIGLLKPSFIMENGYRTYCEEDFMKLQKIVSLKHLGFSLDEIHSMIISGDTKSVAESLDVQITLLDEKIKHLSALKESLMTTRNIFKKDAPDWNSIVELIQLSNQEEKMIEHYRNANNLSVRIKLHEEYSTNKQKWFPWIYNNIDFRSIYRLLEVGSGNGKLWEHNTMNLRNREIFLSDISAGMVRAMKEKLGDDFSYMVIDCMKIPFKKDFFDTVIANHMLFYLSDVHAGLKEIQRVMKDGGTFFCSTYGSHHMEELTQLVQEFDKRITLSDNTLFDIFGLDNGEAILRTYFKEVRCIRYEDSLCVDQAMPIYEYIMSCHGNQKEILSGNMDVFKQFLEKKVSLAGKFHIKKDAGLFICKK